MAQPRHRIPKQLLPFMAIEGGLKLFAAWKAYRNRQFKWCMALVLVNSAGVLPLLYLWRFREPRPARI